ncbi:hypothetical protein PMAN_a0616 [Pseudoalteromonas marina]|nr:hypothetical protein PMAN_a0616 [Pseudoalteromonas marina]
MLCEPLLIVYIIFRHYVCFKLINKSMLKQVFASHLGIHI